VPDYVDIDVCACFVDDGASYRTLQCITCCGNSGYSSSSFILNKGCTCGDLPLRQDIVVCAEAKESLDVCMTCCTEAGFTRATRSGDSCACSGGSDSTICAATVALPNAILACPYCCIANGYLGVDYSAFVGGPHCTCS
jgi:hypothetical protein